MTETSRIIGELRDAVAEEKRLSAIAILRAIVLATPVGNPSLWLNPDAAPPGYVGGTARANWQVSIDAATNVVIDDPDPSGSATIQQGTQVAGGAQIGQTVWIVNNLPYIGRLNDGHSTQAPAGFVEAAVQVGITRTGAT
jgi:hypothetical protein